VSAKTCNKCGETKSLNEYYRDNKNGDGIRSRCKRCVRETSRLWRERNIEHDRERSKEYSRRYREANINKVRKAQRAPASREYQREYQRRRYEANREAIIQRTRQYRETNREMVLARQRRYRQANPDKARESQRRYAKGNPDQILTKAHRQRARKRNAEGSHTAQEWLEVVWKQGFACATCREIKPLTRDHIIPLSKGGSNYISNIQGLCASCNSSKGAKMPDEIAS
jgi:5-methylcytosine-specific restriction endonuclease McrA